MQFPEHMTKRSKIEKPAERERAVSPHDPIDTDLYGVHTPKAADRNIPENDRAFDEGENWIEALEQRAAEGGPEPEHSVAVVDENDEPPRGDHRDRPVADRGSGGDRGK